MFRWYLCLQKERQQNTLPTQLLAMPSESDSPYRLWRRAQPTRRIVASASPASAVQQLWSNYNELCLQQSIANLAPATSKTMVWRRSQSLFITSTTMHTRIKFDTHGSHNPPRFLFPRSRGNCHGATVERRISSVNASRGSLYSFVLSFCLQCRDNGSHILSWEDTRR